MMSETHELTYLKPCDFCGADAERQTRFSKGGDNRILHIVQCERRFDTCLMNARTKKCATQEEAAKAWNTRIGDSK